MAKKKRKNNSRKSNKYGAGIYDITISDFADSNAPPGVGKRLSKAKNTLKQVREISNSKDVTPTDTEALDILPNVSTVTVNHEDLKKSESNQYTEYPLKIWLLVSEYISPEDVQSFSLICKATSSVVNTPHFWIRLYKRFYKKSVTPKCLSYNHLQNHLGLKQRVVRSLYYLYSPFASSLTKECFQLNESIGKICLHQSVLQSSRDKDSNEDIKWTYSFKLSSQNFTGIYESQKKLRSLNAINYNMEKSCLLMKVEAKDYIVLPNVLGARLRDVICQPKVLLLIFSSAPLSKALNSDLGCMTIRLEFCQSPKLVPWWHPDYWKHGNCCRNAPRA